MLYNLINTDMYKNIYLVQVYDLENYADLMRIFDQCNSLLAVYTIIHKMDKSQFIKNNP